MTYASQLDAVLIEGRPLDNFWLQCIINSCNEFECQGLAPTVSIWTILILNVDTHLQNSRRWDAMSQKIIKTCADLQQSSW